MLNSTIKKIIFMYSTSVLSILFGFLVSIFNSRVLGPDTFGDYKFIETVARFIASVVSVGLFISITRLLAMSNDKVKEKKYIGLSTLIMLITSGIGVILYIIFSAIEPHLFNNDFEYPILRYFMIVVSILAHLALLEILKGLHKIYTLALLGVLTPLIYLLIAYILNQFLEIDIDIVIFGYYGILFSIIIIVLYKLKPDFNVNRKIISELLHENKNNGRPIYFGSLAGVATTHIAGISISYFLNNTQVGFFMLSITICTPLLAIPSVLGTIYYKRFVNLPEIPKKIIYFSLLCTILALIVFYLFIEFIVVSFYSLEYLPVANISKLLIVAFLFHGLGDLINRFLGAKGKGHQLRNAAFFVGFVNIFGYTILIWFFDINGAITTRILASCLYLVVMYYYYHNFTKMTRNVSE